MKKLIIDTDIGDDIDDAFALLLALRSPEIELAGVTTVFKDTVRRAKMAMALIESAGGSAPVFSGCGQPLLEPVRPWKNETSGGAYPVPCQYDDAWDEYVPEAAHAVDFIIEASRRDPGLTVAAIGPLTNLALALRKDTRLNERIEIVIMGGDFQTERPEWNVMCDPEAAEIVFRSNCPLRCVGLNVTTKCPLPDKIKANMKRGDAAVRFIDTAYAKWKTFFGFDKSVLHDPLAIMTLIDDPIVWERTEVSADLRDHRGVTVRRTGEGRTFVAADVDVKAFSARFAERLGLDK